MKKPSKESLRAKLYEFVDQKNGDIGAYKDIINIIWEYLRYVLGFMICNLVMEKAFRITQERFPDFNIMLTSDGIDFRGLENSDQNIDALEFYIDNLIDIMENLAGDILLKGLIRRINNKKNIS